MVVLKVIAGVLLLAGAGLVTAAWVGGSAWDASTASRVERLVPIGLEVVALDPADLPDPVRQYLAGAVSGPARGIIRAELIQAGEFKLGEGPDGWRPFHATETFRTSPPAFLWDARIRLAPGADVRVRDSYADGRAEMKGRILGIFSVVDMDHSAALAEGALARYLAEAVWFPTRLSVGPGLRWIAVDDRSAIARLEDGDTRVELLFTFDEEGDPVEVRGIRPREVNGRFEATEWVGRFSDHREMDGFRIPAYGEVAWILDGDESLYWKGRIESVSFELGAVRGGGPDGQSTLDTPARVPS